MKSRALPEPVRDVLLLAARALVAFVMLAHVWATFVLNGFVSTADVFATFGIPLAIAATAFTLVVELVSSILLLAGIFVTWASGFLAFVMAGAIYFVHAPHGVFVKNNGWELVGMIIAVVIALAAAGPGRLSLDHLLFRRSREQQPEPIIASVAPAWTAQARPGLPGRPVYPQRTQAPAPPVAHASSWLWTPLGEAPAAPLPEPVTEARHGR